MRLGISFKLITKVIELLKTRTEGIFLVNEISLGFPFLLQLAQELLTKEVVNYEDVAAILGPCPYGDKRARFYSPEAAPSPPSSAAEPHITGWLVFAF